MMNLIMLQTMKKTLVSNFLRHEEHAELDDTIDVQVKILDAIENIMVSKPKIS